MDNKKVLLTAGRAYPCLDLARRMKEEGHTVYVCDPYFFHMCCMSNSVAKSFVVASPRHNSKQFVDDVYKIVEKYEIDLVIPILEETIHLAKEKEKFDKITNLFCDSYDKLLRLHNKWTFTDWISKLGFDIPVSELIVNEARKEKSDLQYPYILKQTFSRASQGVHWIYEESDLDGIAFCKDNPFMAQELVDGERYCTYGICHEGKLCAFSVYPVRHSIKNTSCLTFHPEDHPGILQWVSKFAEKINYTGQLCFDFIEKEDGTLYCIECNPRTTSGLHLLIDEKNIVDAFFHQIDLVLSENKRSKQLGTGMMIYGWRSGGLKNFFKVLFGAKDVLFSRKDLKPFVFQPLLFFHIIWKSIRTRKNLSKIFTYDMDFESQHIDEDFELFSQD